MPNGKKPRLLGPISHENWRAFKTEAPCTGWLEVPLYTDCYIMGAASGANSLGPFELLNTVPQAPTSPQGLLPC